MALQRLLEHFAKFDFGQLPLRHGLRLEVGPGSQNDRFMNVCEGTSQNQWSNTPKPLAIVQHRHLLRRVAGHDLRVLLVGGLAAHLAVKVLM